MFSKLSKIEQEIISGLIYLAFCGNEDDVIKIAQQSPQGEQPQTQQSPAQSQGSAGTIKEMLARLPSALANVVMRLRHLFNMAITKHNVQLTNPTDINQSIQDILSGKGGGIIKPELINKQLPQVVEVVQNALKQAQQSGIDNGLVLQQVQEMVSRYVPGAKVYSDGQVKINSDLRKVKIALVQEMVDAATDLDELGLHDQADVLDDIISKISD